jgi:fucose 4-O-acetylase-like acetyltransferase
MTKQYDKSLHLTNSISDKFKWWVFISIILIVFLHGYNLQQRFLQPWTTVQEALTPTTFTEYFIANGVLRFLIPMLFAISGFLYALHDQAPNSRRIRRRLRTLLLPYLMWSTFAIIMTWLLELFPYTRNLVFTSGIAYIDNHRRLLHDYRWFELLRSWLFSTIAYQLWFLRVLFMYNLVYPLLRWCIGHPIVKWIFWVVLLLLWMGSFESVVAEGEGLLFFSFGIWIQKMNFNIDSTAYRKRTILVWAGLLMASAAAKTWLAFKGQAMLGNQVFPAIILLHKLTVASGLIAGWFGLDGLSHWCMRNRRFVTLTAFSFFIYAFHTPLVGYAINPVLSWLYPLAAYRLLGFLLLPLTVIAFSIGLGALFRRIAAGTYRLLTGGRGL